MTPIGKSRARKIAGEMAGATFEEGQPAAMDLPRTHRPALNRVAQTLVEGEVVSGDDTRRMIAIASGPAHVT